MPQKNVKQPVISKQSNVISGYSSPETQQYDTYEFQLSEKTYLLKPIDGTIVPFGDAKNQFPNELATLLRRSKILRGIVNDKADLFAGTEFITSNPKLQEFIDNIYPDENQSLMEFHELNVIDRLSGGNGYFLVIKNGKNDFAFQHLQDVNCRVDINSNVVFNPDWSKRQPTLDKVYPLFPDFTEVDGLLCASIHVKDYERGFNYYGVPTYITGLVNGEIDYRTDAWNLEHIKTGYKTDNVVVMPNGASEPTMQAIIEKHKAFRYGKPGGFFYLTGDESKLIPQNSKVMDQDWGALNEVNVEKAIIANSWYKSLTSIAQNTGFDTNRIQQEYTLALRKIRKDQLRWLAIYKRIFKYFNIDATDLDIRNESIIPAKSQEQMLLDMQSFLSEPQKAEIGTHYFEQWKNSQ